MDKKNYNPNDTWDEGVYGTGSTKPPKSRGGLVAVLLVMVIFLSGITCALGILNIRLSRQLETTEKNNNLPISFSGDNQSSGIHSQDPGTQNPGGETGNSNLNINLQEASDGTVLSWTSVYEKNIPSVVSIICATERGNSTGTGVILTADGYIVTNCHVVDSAQSITVLLSDDRSFPAMLVGSDVVSDLAVLYIEAGDLTPAEFGDSTALKVGEPVVAIGDPLGIEYRGTMTDGIISAINRDVTVEGRVMTLIQTNAALNSGNSGGPLINQQGQVIGINTIKIGTFSDLAGVEGLGFAIPSATMIEIVEQLMDQGYVSGRPTIGITGEGMDLIYRYYYRLPNGLYITAVAKGSPAAKLGIEEGDILISLDGTEITSMEELNAVLYAHEVGDRLEIVVYRDGKEYAETITLAENKG